MFKVLYEHAEQLQVHGFSTYEEAVEFAAQHNPSEIVVMLPEPPRCCHRDTQPEQLIYGCPLCSTETRVSVLPADEW